MLAHTGALATMRSYAAQGSDPNLRRVASSAVPIIERHLQMAREMLQSFH
jgi:putative membrane protein